MRIPDWCVYLCVHWGPLGCLAGGAEHMIGVVGLLLLLSDDRKNPSPAQQHSFIFINSSIKNMLVSMCGWECATVCVCVCSFSYGWEKGSVALGGHVHQLREYVWVCLLPFHTGKWAWGPAILQTNMNTSSLSWLLPGVFMDVNEHRKLKRVFQTLILFTGGD